MPRLAILLLSLALLGEAAWQALRWHAAAAAAGATAPSSASSSVWGRAPPSSVDAVIAANLFGAALADTSPAAPAGQAVDYTLNGTIATRDPLQGLAILGEPGGGSHLALAGMLLADGTRLVQVFPDHVVLLRGGRPLTLALRHIATTRLASGNRPHVPGFATAAGIAPEPPPVPRELPVSGAILRSLNLRPVRSRGEITGMRVTGSIDARDALGVLGLAPGDVIVSVDGASEGGPSLAALLMHRISEGEPLRLTVQRDGKLVAVAVDPGRAEAAAQKYRDSSSP